jgi:hypothetical protein
VLSNEPASAEFQAASAGYIHEREWLRREFEMMKRLRHATLQMKLIVVSMLTSAGAVCLTFGPIVAYELVTAERGIAHSLTEMATLLVVVLVLSCGAAYVLVSHFQCIISAPILSLAETASHVSKQKDYSISPDNS